MLPFFKSIVSISSDQESETFWIIFDQEETIEFHDKTFHEEFGSILSIGILFLGFILARKVNHSESKWSKNQNITAEARVNQMVIFDILTACCFVGQVTLWSSDNASLINLFNIFY